MHSAAAAAGIPIASHAEPWARLELVTSSTPITADNKAKGTILLCGHRPSFTIGRVEGNDCVLENPCISGIHCIFSYVMSSSFNSAQCSADSQHHHNAPPASSACTTQAPLRRVSIVDKSSNGVTVNGGAPIGKNNSMALKDGDLVDLVYVAHARNAKYRMQYRLVVVQPVASAVNASASAAPVVVQSGAKAKTPPPPPAAADDQDDNGASPQEKGESASPSAQRAGTAAFHRVPSSKTSAPMPIPTTPMGMSSSNAAMPTLSQMGPNTQVMPYGAITAATSASVTVQHLLADLQKHAMAPPTTATSSAAGRGGGAAVSSLLPILPISPVSASSAVAPPLRPTNLLTANAPVPVAASPQRQPAPQPLGGASSPHQKREDAHVINEDEDNAKEEEQQQQHKGSHDEASNHGGAAIDLEATPSSLVGSSSNNAVGGPPPPLPVVTDGYGTGAADGAHPNPNPPPKPILMATPSQQPDTPQSLIVAVPNGPPPTGDGSAASSNVAKMLAFISDDVSQRRDGGPEDTAATNNHATNPTPPSVVQRTPTNTCNDVAEAATAPPSQAKTLPVPQGKALNDTQPQPSQSAAMAITLPPRPRRATVDEVYALLKDSPLGSGAFATVYKAHLKQSPSVSGDGGPIATKAHRKEGSQQQERQRVPSTNPSLVDDAAEEAPLVAPAGGPFFAVKVLDKTRLMGQSLKDEDRQYFASLVGKGDTKAARARLAASAAAANAMSNANNGGGGATSASPRKFVFGADGAPAVSASDVLCEEAKLAAAEATNAEALRQLMDMDSDGDEEDADSGGISEEDTADTANALFSPSAAARKRARSPNASPAAPSQNTIRRRRVKAGEIEARHEFLLALLTADVRQRYERYLKEKLRWRREVMILRSVAHPNVIRTFDVFDTETTLSLVLELAEGGNLYGLITDGGSLPELLVKVIVYQLLTGVQHLHLHGIVHRDIKLENLLVGRPFTIGGFVAASRQALAQQHEQRQVGGGGMQPPSASSRGGGMSLLGDGSGVGIGIFNRAGGGGGADLPPSAMYDITALPAEHLWPDVKITDFGLSRMLGEGTTTMQTMCGTPIYAAPEVTIVKLREDAQGGYTAAVDIYSIGVVAFALLTARPPFPHPKDNCGRDVKSRIMYEKPLTWNRKSAHGTIAPVTSLGRELVTAMLALRPADRITADEALLHPWFADVRAVLAAL